MCITKIAALQIEKATLGRDKQHPEEEKEIEVAKVARLRNIGRFDADILREALRSSEHVRDADKETHDFARLDRQIPSLPPQMLVVK